MLYLISFSIPLFLYISVSAEGIGTYSQLLFAFIVLPILELLLSTSKSPYKENNLYYDVLLYLQLPLLAFAGYLFLDRIGEASILEKGGLIISFGISIAIMGINVGHELGHRSGKFDQLISHLLFLQAHYLHFLIEHNRGHHRYVATPEDPASAPKGMSVFRFIPRSIAMGLKSAINLEKKRLQSKSMPVFSFHNHFINYVLLQTAFMTLLVYFYGLENYFYYFTSAMVGVILLENINYVEHYGLLRKKNPSGRYEKVKPWHSWNSDHIIGRAVLFELTRHSDHHENPNRTYPTLRSLPNAPQLPYGYPTLVLISLIPPLWFKIMDKRIS